MAKPPWARFTKPINPMVTGRPTDTMKSTMPAATPPSSMLATSTPKITRARERPGAPGARRTRRGLGGARTASCSSRRARADLLVLAGVLDGVDLPDRLLEDATVLHHGLREILVHHDVAGDGVDHDGSPRTVELPPLERIQRGVRLDLALEGLDHVDDGGHAVVAAHGHEVRGGGGAGLLLPRLDEAPVLGVLEIGVVMMHRDETDGRGTHGLELGVLSDVAGTDQPDAGLAHAEGGVGLDHRRRVVAGGDEDEEDVWLLILGALEEGREVGHGAGAAPGDLVDPRAPGGFEAALERGEAVLAGRKVGIAHDGRLRVQGLGG